MLALLLAASPQGKKYTLAVGAQGDKKTRAAITKTVATRLKARIKTAQADGVFVKVAGSSKILAEFPQSPSTLHKMLLTSQGRLEIRVIEPASPLFEAIGSEFKFVKIRQSHDAQAMCAPSRAELNRVVRRVVGPQVNTASFYNAEVQEWCAHALGSVSLTNGNVDRVDVARTVGGEPALSIKIRPQDVDRLAENGELDVKMVGIVLDGDLIARSSVSQLRRTPVRVDAPRTLSDNEGKHWLLAVQALVKHPVPMSVVFIEE